MTENTTQRLARLVHALLARTMRSEVPWQPTDEQTTFLAPLEAGTVLVRSVDRDGEAPFELAILNRDGVRIESVVNFNLPESGNLELRQLYDLARRRSFAVDETIDGLLGELDA